MDRDEVARAHAHGMLKVPQECLVRNFRQVQKSTEKDVAAAVSLVAELCKVVAAQDEVNWEKVVANLDRVEERLRKVKKRVARAKSESRALVDRGEKRLRFYEEASETDFVELMIADHLVRSGHTKAGQRAASESGLQDLVDGLVFQETCEIAAQLRVHRNIEPALAWCQDNKSKLRRLDSSLEFALRKFRFLEFANGGKHIEAVAYARKHLATFAADHLEEIQQAVSALAFPMAPEQRSAKAQVKTRTCEGDLEDAKKSSKKRKTGLEPRAPVSSLGVAPQSGFVRSTQTSTRAVFAYPALTKADWEDLARLFELDSNRALSLEQQTTMQVAAKAGLSQNAHLFPGDNNAGVVGIGDAHVAQNTDSSGDEDSDENDDAGNGEENENLIEYNGEEEDDEDENEDEDEDEDSGESEDNDRDDHMETDAAVASSTAPSDLENQADSMQSRDSNEQVATTDSEVDKEVEAADNTDNEAPSHPHKIGMAAKRALDCPCCDRILGQVARRLPMKQQVHSSLVCRLSGVVMTQDNPPMALPNGQVFSEDALRAIRVSTETKKSIKCPYSGEVFDWDDLRRLVSSFRKAPGLFTVTAVAGGVAAGVVVLNVSADQNLSDLQDHRKRCRELQERGILEFKEQPKQDEHVSTGIPRLDARDERLRAHAKAQEQALIEMLNGLKDKSRKEKLQDAAEAMRKFVVGQDTDADGKGK
ncbi:Macrophage erythroblast attacher [Hondaea fermentalgiana]|uniref:Macrophage erythroblast attacher n=1 Tax=Hondaea fermentalgiana TaxID=2315210 RepID=A0A2R5G0S0_9STRA|nr:Macrophage erythroblast attacher [Hondaea fermentalgiana]|eukprot:GBG24600.1 Macrophage erythroblast attacher [Hondaea fermentalgiana]